MNIPSAPVAAPAGSMIADRYELCAPLSWGGMGTVYRGRDRRLGRPVAVKVVSLAADDDHDATRASEHWWWEARIMAAARHPHVVGVFDAVRDRERGYLIMELVEGEDLKHYLRRTGPLPYEEALSVGIQICRALHALHLRGLIHCDVKPHNILRMPSGWVKLADFGIAQEAGLRQRHLRTAAAGPAGVARGASSAILIGTAMYCSPEQALCEPLTCATDVYSLGVVLYELLAGVPPFVGETPDAVVIQHAVAPVPALHRLRPDMPPVVEQAVLGALAKNPARRFASAQAMCAALEWAHRAVTASQAAALSLGAPFAAPRSAAPDREARAWDSSDIAQQLAAIIASPAEGQVQQFRPPDTMPARGAGGGRWRWDGDGDGDGDADGDADGENAGETTGDTDAANTWWATAPSSGSRRTGVSVALLCIATVLGLLVLLALLSSVH